MSFALERARPLASLTTLGLGGPANHFARVTTREALVEALRWAAAQGERVGVLGGGSNLVIRDAGFDGLVVHMATRGIDLERRPDHVLLTAQAGEPWQSVVDVALEEDLAGVECLTGIPGSAGATPIQNVGAYGQEVRDTVDAVEVLDRADLTTHWLAPEDCGFAYRDSRFKRDPERVVVLSVRYRLKPHGEPSVRYPELQRALASRAARPTLRDVASTVRALRAQKSMVLDPNDENRRSAGSFFMNPIVSDAFAVQLKADAVARGVVEHEAAVPAYPAGPGHTKLAAGWLIERAGLSKGLRRGAVGISSKHALSLVHHGGGTTRELLALASEVQARVRDVFGVELAIEPVRW